jgi:2'-5' RNA ligase
MRVFAALPLPQPALARLEKAVGELRRRGGDLRTVRPEGMHITLIFFGELGEERLAEVQSALEDRTLAGPPIDATIGGLGQFPPRGTPRVLYCPVRRGAEQVVALYGRLREAVLAAWGRGASEAGGTAAAGLSGVGLDGRLRSSGRPSWDDGRPFAPHVTVARNRGAPVAVDGFEELFDFEEPACLDRLVLFQSLLKPGGSEYRPLRTVTFKGDKGPPCEPSI